MKFYLVRVQNLFSGCSLLLPVIFFFSFMPVLITKIKTQWFQSLPFFLWLFVCFFVSFRWSCKTYVIHNWSIHLSVGSVIIMVGWYCRTSCYCYTSDICWTLSHLVLPTLPTSAIVCRSISVWCWFCSLPSKEISCVKGMIPRGVVRGHLYEKVGDARQKIWIEPLKETNLGVVSALFDP